FGAADRAALVLGEPGPYSRYRGRRRDHRLHRYVVGCRLLLPHGTRLFLHQDLFAELDRPHCVLGGAAAVYVPAVNSSAPIAGSHVVSAARPRGACYPEWARLGQIAAAGPSTKEELRVELGLKPKEVKLALSPLLRVGAVV